MCVCGGVASEGDNWESAYTLLALPSALPACQHFCPCGRPEPAQGGSGARGIRSARKAHTGSQVGARLLLLARVRLAHALCQWSVPVGACSLMPCSLCL